MTDAAPRRRKMRPLNAIAVERANRAKTKVEEENKSAAKKTNGAVPKLDNDTTTPAQSNKVVVEYAQQQQNTDDHIEQQNESMDITPEENTPEKYKGQSDIHTTTEKTMHKSEKKKKKDKEKDTNAKDSMVIDEPVKHKSKNKKSKDTEKIKEGSNSVEDTSSKKKNRKKDKTSHDKQPEEHKKKTPATEKSETKVDDKEKKKQEKSAHKRAEKELQNMDNEISKEERKAAKRKEKQDRKEKKKQRKLSMDDKQDTTQKKGNNTITTDKSSTASSDTNGDSSNSQTFFEKLLSMADKTDREKDAPSPLPSRPPHNFDYLSASDSDDTDEEKSVRPTKKKTIPPPPTINYLSASDSDSTDEEKSTPHTKAKNIAPSTTNYQSASGSDDTDEEKSTQHTKIKNITPTTNYQSASDSDDTDGEKSARPAQNRVNTTAKNSRFRTTNHIFDSDDDEANQQLNDIQPVQKSNIDNLDKIPLFKFNDKIESNRLVTNRRKKFDDKTSIETKLSGRYNTEFVPTVNENFFISDSESDTDSDDSYTHPSPYRWHNEISWYGKEGKNGQNAFPKSRKFGFSDRIKLEKRIKKICRRKNMSFDDFKELTQGKISEHKEFWRMIVKVFPDRCLRHVANYCQEVYSPQKTFDGITAEEIEQFKDLIQLHGEKPKILAEKMGSSRNRINYLLKTVRRSIIPTTPTGQEKNGELVKQRKRWTKAQVDVLRQQAEEHKNKNGAIDFDTVALAFQGDFSTEQCREKYRRIDGLKVKEGGSLQKTKDISLIDILDYYKSLLQQVKNNGLKDESQLEFKKGMTGPLASWNGRAIYLKARLNIKGVEKMKIKDILESLIERQERSIAYRREEGLLD